MSTFLLETTIKMIDTHQPKWYWRRLQSDILLRITESTFSHWWVNRLSKLFSPVQLLEWIHLIPKGGEGWGWHGRQKLTPWPVCENRFHSEHFRLFYIENSCFHEIYGIRIRKNSKLHFLYKTAKPLLWFSWPLPSDLMRTLWNKSCHRMTGVYVLYRADIWWERETVAVTDIWWEGLPGQISCLYMKCYSNNLQVVPLCRHTVLSKMRI